MIPNIHCYLGTCMDATHSCSGKHFHFGKLPDAKMPNIVTTFEDLDKKVKAMYKYSEDYDQLAFTISLPPLSTYLSNFRNRKYLFTKSMHKQMEIISKELLKYLHMKDTDILYIYGQYASEQRIGDVHIHGIIHSKYKRVYTLRKLKSVLKKVFDHPQIFIKLKPITELKAWVTYLKKNIVEIPNQFSINTIFRSTNKRSKL